MNSELELKLGNNSNFRRDVIRLNRLFENLDKINNISGERYFKEDVSLGKYVLDELKSSYEANLDAGHVNPNLVFTINNDLSNFFGVYKRINDNSFSNNDNIVYEMNNIRRTVDQLKIDYVDILNSVKTQK